MIKNLNAIELIREQLYEEGKQNDDEPFTYDNFTCPNFITNHTCSLNDEEYQRIMIIFQKKDGISLGLSSLF